MDSQSYEKGLLKGQEIVLESLLLSIEEGDYLESIEQWAIQQLEWINERQKND